MLFLWNQKRRDRNLREFLFDEYPEDFKVVEKWHVFWFRFDREVVFYGKGVTKTEYDGNIRISNTKWNVDGRGRFELKLES